MAFALAGGVSALLLGMAAPSQAAQAGLTHAELPAVLTQSWWCSVGEDSSNSKPSACESVIRYRLVRDQIQGQSCTALSLEEVAALGGFVEALAPAALDRERELLGSVNARASAVGADRIKICETVTHKRRLDGSLCSKPFELQADSRWSLSSSGRWEDEADLPLPREEVVRLYPLIAEAGSQAIANLPAEALGDPDVKTLASMFGPDLVCEAFSMGAEGVLQSRLVGAGDSTDFMTYLVPISGPDVVQLDPA
ncbi:MAG: hypothetical protein SWI22_13935 [Pseudomonadota bacterium]|nr:hypothetical protein [Pseudomonadota bacterium]